MSSSQKRLDSIEPGARPAVDEYTGDVTATDLPVTLPEYLSEMRAALARSEQGYACGDLATAAAAAAEGLAAIRLSQTRVGSGQGPPPHYTGFFHCFQIQAEFRQALALYKQAALRREPAVALERQELLRQAWQILEPATAGLAENLSAELLVYDYPVAGRVLRGVLRLRQKLRGALAGGSRVICEPGACAPGEIV